MRNYANLGEAFEELVKMANDVYARRNIALVQKISTPWNIVRQGKKIIHAFPEGKSTLDFRGTLSGGQSISFDCKETQIEVGLPLANIEEHQIEYIRTALKMGEWSFILVSLRNGYEYFYVPGKVVLEYWETWQRNKGKRGFNTILRQDMQEIRSSNGIALDYISALRK
jgi:recombination protein U